MKLKIILVVQTLVMVFFIVLSTIKAKEAEIQVVKAEKLAEEAIALSQRAQEEAQRAEMLAAEAIKIQTKLEECRSGN